MKIFLSVKFVEFIGFAYIKHIKNIIKVCFTNKFTKERRIMFGEKMNIIHLSYSDTGGAGIAAYRLHKGLIQNNINSKIIVNKKTVDDYHIISPSGILEKIWAKFSNYFDYLPNKLLIGGENRFQSLAYFPDMVYKKVNSLDPDIINLHWICGGFLRIENLIKFNKPFIWTLHDMWPFCGAEHHTKELRYKKGYSIINRSPEEKGIDLNKWVWQRKMKILKKIKNLKIVAPSKWIYNCAKSSKLFENYDISLIPNGLDVNVFKPINYMEARKLLNLPADKRLILFGSLNPASNPYKGFEFLEKLLKKLKENTDNNNIEIVILGSSEPEKPLNLGFKVNYIGRLWDEISIALTYSACDIFIAPSKDDNLPNTVLEALACGTPCLAFDIGGMPDMIEHKINGYLAKPFDVDDLYEGFNFILNNKKEKFLDAAHGKIKENFTIDIQAKKYIELYRSLI